ncbi:hypothetical protein BJY04DRAFT_202982 [Aspergillus karnatakaensis]|uniref:uncharacterized protein n=1 Tax=Aspergillus karnatakaensis TaxID=1810916 RepID=UPI003CCE0966
MTFLEGDGGTRNYITFSPTGSSLIFQHYSGYALEFAWPYDNSSPERIEDSLYARKVSLTVPEQNWAIGGRCRWITFRDTPIMYLPESRKAHICDILGNTIVIGSCSGIVTILRFKDLEEFVI